MEHGAAGAGEGAPPFTVETDMDSETPSCGAGPGPIVRLIALWDAFDLMRRASDELRKAGLPTAADRLMSLRLASAVEGYRAHGEDGLMPALAAAADAGRAGRGAAADAGGGGGLAPTREGFLLAVPFRAPENGCLPTRPLTEASDIR